uniref:Protein krueppel n=1 Tax=Anopheles christyi TaxID=43041 RepID=A0A182K5V3_9DIPT
MLSVCRLCAHWAEPYVEIDNILFENLQAKDVIQRMFGLDLSCTPSYTDQLCKECVQNLENSFVFHQQLVNAEKVFNTLHESGALRQSLLAIKKAGEPLLQTEELLVVERLCDLPKNNLEDKPKESTENQSDCGEFPEDCWHDKKAEKVIEIKIEAVEELEIISNPLDSSSANGVPYQEMKISSGDEESCTLSQTSSNEAGLEFVNGTRSVQNAEQKANRAIVPNKCYVCYKIYGNEAELTAHLIEHNDLLPFRCRQCSTNERVFEYRTIRALNKHLETHRYPFDCTECRLRFRKITTRNDHFLRMHMSVGVYTCERCGVEFQELRKFRLHLAAHRNLELQRYKCTICSKAFQTSTLLVRHKFEVHASKPPNQQCMRLFKAKSNYMPHKKLLLQQEGLIECSETGCVQQFTSFREWRRHMKTHYPEEPLYWEHKDILPESLQDASSYPKACLEAGCSYVAATLSLMFCHYRMHYKSFQCDQCNSKYSSVSALRRHVEIRHEGVRRFECSHCGKRFAYRQKLHEHENVHLGVRNLKCNYCTRTFSSRSNLTVHRRTHASTLAANSNRCALCETTFLDSASLAHHHQAYLKSDHSGNSACERIQKRKQKKKEMLREQEQEQQGELESSSD